MIASTQSFYERSQPHHSWLRFNGDGDSELMKRSKIAETVRQRMAHSVFLYHQSACNWRLAQRAASATCLKLGMFRVLPCQEPASQHHWRQKSEGINGINMIMLTSGERLHLVIIGVSMVIDSRKAPRSVASHNGSRNILSVCSTTVQVQD